jgi:2-polyprenyl-3-methyl-5-hydroxy-6-metoxy-1,4-benzoquinol methylase
MTTIAPLHFEADPDEIHGSENADVHASSDEYARRFGGAVGAWMLNVQESALTRMLPSHVRTVLDIGGGHGQIALPLSNLGRSVTILGSSPACAKRMRQHIENGSISFKCGNLVELPFHDRSFDGVVSFRLMSHCTAWRRLIAEMCRVADSTVIFDYPVWCSSNFLTPLFFSIKRKIEGNTRLYKIFTTRELEREFRAHGFRRVAIHKQFFFPMGVHRALKRPRLSKALEGIPRGLLLTRLFGSPIVIAFERIQADD